MPTGVTAARACAYAVVRRVFEHGAYADRAFHAEGHGLSGRDRAFAMALAYGTIQRRATLDHVAAAFSKRPPERLDAPVLAALRLGLEQILLMDGVAEHAAVHESVELAKRHSRGGSGLVNAVLRRAAREGREVLAGLNDGTPADAAVLHSVPQWLAELWFSELGAERARALLAAVNRPPESAIRINTLAGSVADLADGLGVAWHAAPGIAEGLVLDEPFDAYSSAAWERGELMSQSRGSMTVARTLAPERGERVLDLCAAPGAKTTHLAALTGDTGGLVAVERHPGRAAALRATLKRMHVRGATVEIGDAAMPRPRDGFDRVLVDPPCSGLGTLQSRPDLRWRTSPERIADLAHQQARFLAAGATATRSGGVLVYSVCTICRAESDAVTEAFLSSHPDWAGEPALRLAPDTDGTDGFYIAALRRS
ncbi:MAG: 16S rRNA (cytosine(967)-C(5))-methyltransferase RsmB [Solirubrobacteraceae bacterium]